MNETPLTLAEAGKRLGKSAKTIGRWIETISGFPQPIRLGASLYLIEEEIDAYIEYLKEKRKSRRTKE